MTEKELEQLITNYSWMIKEIEQLRLQVKDLSDSDFFIKQRLLKRLEDLEVKVGEVQKRIELITDDKEAAVLYWLLNGKKHRWIAKIFNTSHVTISNIKNNIVKKMLRGC